jgi:BolA protein
MLRVPRFRFSMESEIVKSIRKGLEVVKIDIKNESHRHSRGEESHYVVNIVSPSFIGMSAVQRH